MLAVFIVSLVLLWLGRSSSDLYRLGEFSTWTNLLSSANIFNLLIGIGLGSASVFLKRNLLLDYWAYQPAHFGPLNILLELGIIPILIMILFLALPAFKTNTKSRLAKKYNKQENTKELVWVTSFGSINTKDRRYEVYSSVQSNLKANIFTKIYIFSENKTELDNLKKYLSRQNEAKQYLYKMVFIVTEKLFNIQQMFNQLSYLELATTICLSNSDISFSDNFNWQVHENLGKSDFCAITRYQNDVLYSEGRSNKLSQLYSTSQDTWVASLQDWKLIQKDFYLGRKSVDNLLAFNAFKIGLQVSNPSLSVRTDHNHSLNLKEWENKQEYHGFKLFLTANQFGEISDKEIIWE